MGVKEEEEEDDPSHRLSSPPPTTNGFLNGINRPGGDHPTRSLFDSILHLLLASIFLKNYYFFSKRGFISCNFQMCFYFLKKLFCRTFLSLGKKGARNSPHE